MIDLLTIPCRWRSAEEIIPGRWGCASGKVFVTERGVSLELCAGCYLRDHQPETTDQLAARAARPQAAAPAPTPDGVERLKTCRFRGRSVKGPSGVALKRLCVLG